MIGVGTGFCRSLPGFLLQGNFIDMRVHFNRESKPMAWALGKFVLLNVKMHRVEFKYILPLHVCIDEVCLSCSFVFALQGERYDAERGGAIMRGMRFRSITSLIHCPGLLAMRSRHCAYSHYSHSRRQQCVQNDTRQPVLQKNIFLNSKWFTVMVPTALVSPTC